MRQTDTYNSTQVHDPVLIVLQLFTQYMSVLLVLMYILLHWLLWTWLVPFHLMPHLCNIIDHLIINVVPNCLLPKPLPPTNAAILASSSFYFTRACMGTSSEA